MHLAIPECKHFILMILYDTRRTTYSLYNLCHQEEMVDIHNIRRTKFQHLQDSRTVLRLSLPNPLKPDVKSRMKM